MAPSWTLTLPTYFQDGARDRRWRPAPERALPGPPPLRGRGEGCGDGDLRSGELSLPQRSNNQTRGMWTHSRALHSPGCHGRLDRCAATWPPGDRDRRGTGVQRARRDGLLRRVFGIHGWRFRRPGELRNLRRVRGAGCALPSAGFGGGGPADHRPRRLHARLPAQLHPDRG